MCAPEVTGGPQELHQSRRSRGEARNISTRNLGFRSEEREVEGEDENRINVDQMEERHAARLFRPTAAAGVVGGGRGWAARDGDAIAMGVA